MITTIERPAGKPAGPRTQLYDCGSIVDDS